MKFESSSPARSSGSVAIVATFVLALLLTALPMPEWAALWRPAWVALVLVYWCLAAPARVGVFTGWALGLLLDAMSGTLLGQHALALAVVAFACQSCHHWIRALPLSRQCLCVFAVLGVYQLIVVWVSGLQGLPVAAMSYAGPALVSMLLWPWLFVLLRDLRRRYRIA